MTESNRIEDIRLVRFYYKDRLNYDAKMTIQSALSRVKANIDSMSVGEKSKSVTIYITDSVMNIYFG